VLAHPFVPVSRNRRAERAKADPKAWERGGGRFGPAKAASVSCGRLVAVPCRPLHKRFSERSELMLRPWTGLTRDKPARRWARALASSNGSHRSVPSWKAKAVRASGSPARGRVVRGHALRLVVRRIGGFSCSRSRPESGDSRIAGLVRRRGDNHPAESLRRPETDAIGEPGWGPVGPMGRIVGAPA